MKRLVYLSLFVLLSEPGCNAEPIELRYVTSGTEDQRNPDALDDDEPELGSAPASLLDGAVVSAGFSVGPECDDFPHDCALAGREKCTLVSNNPGYRSSCVPSLGELLIGEECERRVRGDDNCAPGGFCTPLGRGFDHENRLICRKLCARTAECDDGQRCLSLLADESRGLCVDECTVFDDDCGGEELRCAASPETDGGFFGYCEIFGSFREGDECFLTSQCGNGMSCELSSQRCRFSCDEEHPCPEDRRCVPLRLGERGSLRLCVP